MSTDNRTLINDCDANTGWSGDDTANAIATAGSFIEGAGALSTQLSNADEEMSTTEDSVGGGAFGPVDWSDFTVYMNIKDKLGDSFANGGAQFVIGDGTDRIGYFIAGNDAVGMPYALFFAAYKLDISVVDNAPGVVDTNFHEYAGTEANNNLAAVTVMGFGSLHLAKAVGSIDNVIMDGFYAIANDSYALTINGGTVGTPETMTDVAGDDITNGWGLIANPFGTQFIFFGPTEWGESAANADHYFTASGEQWYWMGDNSGGHAVGATHFPFRVVGNATDTGLFRMTSVAIVNTGTPAEFDCSDTDIDTLEIDLSSAQGLASFQAPSAGGTSRFCTNTIFSECGVVTHNGASMNGSSVLSSTVAADDGALFYDEVADPDGEMDGMSFSKGTNAHHAIRFGANVPASITLRNMDFTGFGSSDDANDSVFRFDDTTGSITLNLVGCTHDGSGFTVDDAAGVTVTVVIDPVTTLVNVVDNNASDLINARVLLEASDGAGDFPFEESVTISRVASVASVAHTGHGMVTGDLAVIRGADQPEYNGAFVITNVTTNAYDYTVSGSPATTATGTIICSGAIISGLTDSSGDISASRTFSANTLVKGFVRKASSPPYFKSFQIAGEIDNTTGLTINVRMILDQ